jgi:hypothetical protein
MSDQRVPPSLVSVKGRQLVEVTKDGSWWFRFKPAFSVSVECLWRVTDANRIVVTSEDQDQRFGLPEPIDAARRARLAIGDNPVVDVKLRGPARDLLIVFANGAMLEVLPNSAGYENWHFFAEDGREGRVLGGGSLQA